MNIELSKGDLLILNNVLNEILNGPDAIADGEFQTRIGIERKEAEILLKKIGSMLDKK